MAQQYFKVTGAVSFLVPARNQGDADSQIFDCSADFIAERIAKGDWVMQVDPDPARSSVEHVPRERVIDMAHAMGARDNPFDRQDPRLKKGA
jgi:hypothetical protein